MRPQTIIVALAAAAPALVAPAQNAPNTLTPAEKASGWQLLFDGASTDGWRGYRQDAFPAQGWSIEDGALRVHAGGGGGDIITEEMYGDFELELEYKVAAAANSGIMYRVQEKHSTTWQTGPEYQVLDDQGAGAAPDHPHSAGALYDLAAPAEGKLSKPAGQWNSVRIVLKDGRLEHWLNGVKVVDMRMDDEAWRQTIAGSKFAGYEGFGVLEEGHIALQEHGNDVWFRSIKLREQSGALPGEAALIGRGLRGLVVHPGEGDGAWKVADGVLRTDGQPVGYIRTEEAYGDFVCRFQYRFPEQAGNSGFLFQVTGADTVWPSCLEAQLHHGSAGDFINIGELPLTPDAARTSGKRTAHARNTEREAGEWNDYEVIVLDGKVTVRVNGIVVNEADGADRIEGRLAWQSEGAPIEFREIFVKRLGANDAGGQMPVGD